MQHAGGWDAYDGACAAYKGCEGCEQGVVDGHLKQEFVQLNERVQVVNIQEAVGTGEEARGQTWKGFSEGSYGNDRQKYRLDSAVSCYGDVRHHGGLFSFVSYEDAPLRLNSHLSLSRQH